MVKRRNQKIQAQVPLQHDFKCISVVRDKISQRTLCVVHEQMERGYTVPVKLQPEPDNLWDPKAIAFVCNVDDKFNGQGLGM